MSNKLKDILEAFKQYGITYDSSSKIIIIREPIHPRDLHFIRKNVLVLKDGVKDIIVGRYNYKKRGM